MAQLWVDTAKELWTQYLQECTQAQPLASAQHRWCPSYQNWWPLSHYLCPEGSTPPDWHQTHHSSVGVYHFLSNLEFSHGLFQHFLQAIMLLPSSKSPDSSSSEAPSVSPGEILTSSWLLLKDTPSRRPACPSQNRWIITTTNHFSFAAPSLVFTAQ